MRFWLLIFLLIPIVEMYLLIQVGGYIGAWPTVALVVLGAIVGVMVLRFQGLATLSRGVRRLEGGELPAREMVEGLLLAVAGVLLVTPGFATDAVGIVLLVPPARRLAARRMLHRAVMGPGGSPSGGRSGRADRAHGPRQTDVIEGEFESRTEDEPRD